MNDHRSQNDVQFDELWRFVSAQHHGGRNSIHGPNHWKRVKENGLAVARFSGANPTVVKLFALFHDSRRVSDGSDPGHGHRGAEFARELRGEHFNISDEEFELLYYACQWHTDEIHHDDPTIGTCWDADRLDLGRVYITPKPKYLNSKAAKFAAVEGSVDFLAKLLPDHFDASSPDQTEA